MEFRIRLSRSRVNKTLVMFTSKHHIEKTSALIDGGSHFDAGKLGIEISFYGMMDGHHSTRNVHIL